MVGAVRFEFIANAEKWSDTGISVIGASVVAVIVVVDFSFHTCLFSIYVDSSACEMNRRVSDRNRSPNGECINGWIRMLVKVMVNLIENIIFQAL